MFLNQLTTAEKEAFISLSVHAANANGIVDEAEYEMLEEYCKEMGIAFFDAKNVLGMDKIESVFKDATSRNKKIALLEILGLLHADGNYDNKESDFIINYSQKIGLSEADVKKYSGFVNRYLSLVKEMAETLQ